MTWQTSYVVAALALVAVLLFVLWRSRQNGDASASANMLALITAVGITAVLVWIFTMPR